MTLSDYPRAFLEFLLTIGAWAIEGVREVWELWLEGRMVERWTWSIEAIP